MSSKFKPTLVVLALFALLIAACAAPTAIPSPAPAASAPASTETVNSTAADNAAPVSFANDVLPILQSRCLNCHGGQDTQRGLSIASYDALMAGSQNGAVIIPGDPNNSLLIQLVQSGRMPKRGSKLTPAELQILVDWIAAGALNN